MARQYMQHGLNALIKTQRRRRHSPVDGRTKAGRSAQLTRLALISDKGGEQASTVILMLIELVVRDQCWLDQIDSHIAAFLKREKDNPKVKGNAAGLAKLYGYRAKIAGSLAKNLAALGVDRVSSEKQLDPYEYAKQQYGEEKKNGTEGREG